jgi:hypothetical protein
LRVFAIVGLIAGFALATLLVLAHGAGAIWHGATALGMNGFALVVGFHLGLIGLMGVAWWLLRRGRADTMLPRFWWGRFVRDSASEALPLSQVGGFVFGARALALTGVSGAFAAASTVVDVTAELVAQLGYTVFGLLLLDRLRPDNTFAGSRACRGRWDDRCGCGLRCRAGTRRRFHRANRRASGTGIPRS